MFFFLKNCENFISAHVKTLFFIFIGINNKIKYIEKPYCFHICLHTIIYFVSSFYKNNNNKIQTLKNGIDRILYDSIIIKILLEQYDNKYD